MVAKKNVSINMIMKCWNEHSEISDVDKRVKAVASDVDMYPSQVKQRLKERGVVFAKKAKGRRKKVDDNLGGESENFSLPENEIGKEETPKIEAKKSFECPHTGCTAKPFITEEGLKKHLEIFHKGSVSGQPDSIVDVEGDDFVQGEFEAQMAENEEENDQEDDSPSHISKGSGGSGVIGGIKQDVKDTPLPPPLPPEVAQSMGHFLTQSPAMLGNMLDDIHFKTGYRYVIPKEMEWIDKIWAWRIKSALQNVKNADITTAIIGMVMIMTPQLVMHKIKISQKKGERIPKGSVESQEKREANKPSGDKNQALVSDEIPAPKDVRGD